MCIRDSSYDGNLPGFYRGTFTVDKVGDSFIDMSSWGKGAVWVNGHSLGKFWSIGPQQTLYLPAPWLKKGKNEIVVFEMESTGKRTLQGLDKPILDVLGIDKHNFATMRNYDLVPVLDKDDGLYKGQAKSMEGWQEFIFDGSRTLRHLCIDIHSTYRGTNSQICEIEILNKHGQAINKANWKVAFTNTESTEGGVAENIFDGDTNTYWRSADETNAKPMPHQIIVDLGNICEVSGVRLYMPTAESEGQIKEFNLYGRPQFFLYE